MELAWLTNLDAPYRRPVWTDLARRWDLTVGLTASPESGEGRVRGADWFEGEPRPYQVEHLATRSIDVRGNTYAIGTGGLRRLVPLRGAIVLGGWESPIYWQAAALARRRGTTCVGFYESTQLSHGHRRGPVAAARRRFFRSMDAVVVPGVAAAEAVRAMGVPQQRIVTGFNAVDVNGIDAAARAARRVADIPGTGHRFVYLGQLVPRKNVAALLGAFASMAGPEDTLDIFGAGDESARLRELAASSPPMKGVTFHPPVTYDDVAETLATHHTLVLPSTTDVWGLVVNEALAAGLHVVVSDACGVARSVETMRGVTVSGTDPASIAAAMSTSRTTWRGWVQDPEILAHSPAAFAAVFERALGQRTPA